MLPLIRGYKATTIEHAFILNSIASALIASMSIEMRTYLDKKSEEKNNTWILTESQKAVIVFITGFITALVTFIILNILFGFGAGMLA